MLYRGDVAATLLQVLTQAFLIQAVGFSTDVYLYGSVSWRRAISQQACSERRLEGLSSPYLVAAERAGKTAAAKAADAAGMQQMHGKR